MQREIFGFFVNLDERGDFYADVRNSEGKTVLEIKTGPNGEPPELIESGYMTNKQDIQGLTDYMREMSLIGKEDRVLPSAKFESELSAMPAQDSADKALEDLEANFGAAFRNKETIDLGGGFFSAEEIKPIHEMLYAHNSNEESPCPGFTGEQRGYVETFMSNLDKAIFDRDTVSIGGGDFERRDLIALRDFLQEQALQYGQQPSAPLM